MPSYLLIYLFNYLFIHVLYVAFCPQVFMCHSCTCLHILRTSNNETLLLVAIKHQLEPVADRLCDLGAEVGVADAAGNSPLWVALRSRQESIAAKLVRTTSIIVYVHAHCISLILSVSLPLFCLLFFYLLSTSFICIMS